MKDSNNMTATLAANSASYKDTNRPVTGSGNSSLSIAAPKGETPRLSIVPMIATTLAAWTEPELGNFAHLTHEELVAAHSRTKSLLPDWKSTSKPWKSPYDHACSDSKLGDFLRSYSKIVGNAGGINQYATIFIYDNGTVVWNSDHQWVTVMAVEKEDFHDYQDRINAAAGMAGEL